MVQAVRAVVVMTPGADPEVREVILPALSPTDVRVSIAAAGVCHSDLSMIDGTFFPSFPLVLGHEASGTVVEIGDQVSRVAAGDRVVLNWAAACGGCWFCTSGQPWLCTAIEGVSSVPGGTLDDGTPVHTCLGVGGFAEEAVLPERAVVPVPDDVPLEVAPLMGCAVLTGVGAVRNTAGVRAGESVVVIGQGGVGLCAVMGAALEGAAPIIAVDVSADKEARAGDAGATHFLLAGDDAARRVREMTEGRGADHAFECVGTGATIRLAWDCVRRGGHATVVGAGRHSSELTLNALEVFHFARTLGSSIYGSSVPDRDIPRLADDLRAGRLDLHQLISHRIGLDGVAGAFARMSAGQGARSVIEIERGEGPASL